MEYCIIRKDLLDGETRGIYPVEPGTLVSFEDLTDKASKLNASASDDVKYIVCPGSFAEVKKEWELSRGSV